MRSIYKGLFRAACVAGRPFGGLRPRRIYHWLARRAFDRPEFAWYSNRWGCRLRLSPYYYLDRFIIATGTYDENLHHYLENTLRPGMTCLDVGANIGEMATHMGKLVGPTGRVHAFEPVPRLAARARENIHASGLDGVVTLNELALSDTSGRLQITAVEDASENQGSSSIVNRNVSADPQTIEIAATTIDEYLAQHQIRHVDLIKADIQGAEWLMIDGGRQCFEQLAPDILMEISPEDLRSLGKTSRDLCMKIESLGYAIHSVSSGSRGPRIDVSTMPEDFSVDNVLCTRQITGRV